jgi:hypothetical protein
VDDRELLLRVSIAMELDAEHLPDRIQGLPEGAQDRLPLQLAGGEVQLGQHPRGRQVRLVQVHLVHQVHRNPPAWFEPPPRQTVKIRPFPRPALRRP